MIGATYSMGHYELYQETKDKNLFEEIVDQMIIDQVPGMNDSFREKISLLDRTKKRMAILSLLDKDRNLFLKIKALFDNNINRLDHIKDVIVMLREYVKVGDVEKKKYGEVMTPLELVKEMLATLPEDVWSNPNLKWLDPANGSGPYPIMVIYKLMVGLKDWEPDDEKRYKHIMENMIYVSELQPKNMFLYMCSVDPFDTYKLNIYSGSYLEEGFDYHMKNIWNIDKFDIVVMNPPYNDGSTNKANSLWDKFVFKTLNINLAENGYLVAVHPSGWRNVEGKFKYVQLALREREMQYINMNTSQEGLKVFGSTTSFDFYCVRNIIGTDIKTKVIDIDNNVNQIKLSDKELIPNYNLEGIFSLIAKDGDERVKILSDYVYEHRRPHMNKEQTIEFKYPCVYSIKNGGIPTFKFSSLNNKGHFGIPKLILGNGANPTYINDFNGEYAMTQFSYGIVDSVDNLKRIEEFLNSKSVKEITRATKFVSTNGNPIIYPKILGLFRKDFWKEFI